MLKYFLTCIMFVLTCSCSMQLSNGQNGGNSKVDPGTLSFSKQTIEVSTISSTTDILTLNNSSGITNLQINFTVMNSSIASLNRYSCSLSSNNHQCSILITGVTPGTTQIVATASYGSYNYTISPIYITVGGGNTPSNKISMSVNGITQTIFTGLKYNATFKFTNNTGSTINLGQMKITGASGLGVSINPAPCSNIPLNIGHSCSVIANGASINTINPTLVSLDFKLTTANDPSKFYTSHMDIAAVPYHPGYAAFRVTNINNPTHTLYIVALGNNGSGQQVVIFDPTTKNGSLSSSASYAQGTLTVPDNPIGITFYQPDYAGTPGGIGGLMYVSFDKMLPISSGSVGPNPTTNANGITFSQYEPNVYNNGNSANLDVTDINFAGPTQGFYAMSSGAASNGSFNVGDNVASGMISDGYANLTTSEIYNQIKFFSSSWPNSWGIPAQFMQTGNPLQWIELIGLVNWFGTPGSYPPGFDQNIYTTYVDDLWNYYTSEQGHKIYIDAGEINAGCTLEAQVNSPTTMLVKPTDATVIGPVPENGIAVSSVSCPASASSDNKNAWSWVTFSALDFVGGAAGTDSTLYGPNKSYKSMGKYISAAQNVGLLPYCPDPNIHYGPQTLGHSPYTELYWTPQYKCLANYNIYTNSVINQYDKIFHTYIPLNYTWAYDDALGISSEVDIDPTKSGFTLDIHKFD